MLADVGLVQDVEAFGIGRHDSVLDAVVDHLDEMPGPVRAAMQKALFGAAAACFSSGGRRCGASAGRECRKDRLQVPDNVVLAANHQAVAAVEPGDAAAGADIDVMDPLFLQCRCAMDIVTVVRIATIDDDIASFKQRTQFRKFLINHGGRHHQPDGARGFHGCDHLLKRGSTDGTQALKAGDCCRLRVMDDAVLALLKQAAHHARTHAPQTNHSYLHFATSLRVAGPRCMLMRTK